MPELKPVGEGTTKKEPVTIPIIGVDGKGSSVTTKIRFWGEPPLGSHDDMVAAIRPDGKIEDDPLRSYLENCLLPDDREKWSELIHGARVFIERSTLRETFTALLAFYTTPRPTKQSPDSRSGRGSTPRTSRAAASVKKSTSKR